jgi:hypothetical protein
MLNVRVTFNQTNDTAASAILLSVSDFPVMDIGHHSNAMNANGRIADDNFMIRVRTLVDAHGWTHCLRVVRISMLSQAVVMLYLHN